MLDKKQLREEGLIFVSQFEGTVHHGRGGIAEEAGQRRCGALLILNLQSGNRGRNADA